MGATIQELMDFLKYPVYWSRTPSENSACSAFQSFSRFYVSLNDQVTDHAIAFYRCRSILFRDSVDH